MTHLYLKNKHIVLGVTGGIAAYKAAYVARGLIKAGARLTTVMTEEATRFITPLTFSALTQGPVYTENDLWRQGVLHVEVSKDADAILVVPATQNFITKTAAGLASNLLSLIISSFRGPIVMVPAMHTNMWEFLPVKTAVTTLRNMGIHVLEPDEGDLSSGDVGKGRLPKEDDIVAFMEFVLAPKDLMDKRVLVTTGPTREAIDPVRVLTNPSTGKMGFQVAWEAFIRGAKVSVISGPASVDPPPFIKDITYVVSAMDMFEEVSKRIKDVDVLVMAAAVVDFAPVVSHEMKIEKSELDDVIRLKRNPDILQYVGELEERPFIVGFAAQTDELLNKATKKLNRKKADLIFANLVGKDRGFGKDEVEAILINKNESHAQLGRISKREAAKVIMDGVVNGLRQ